MSEQLQINIEDLQKLINDELIKNEKNVSLSPNDELLGVIDSMMMIGLLGVLEENYQVIIDGEMLTIENFNSIRSIFKMLQQLKSESYA